jgi:hypothetical protein
MDKTGYPAIKTGRPPGILRPIRRGRTRRCDMENPQRSQLPPCGCAECPDHRPRVCGREAIVKHAMGVFSAGNASSRKCRRSGSPSTSGRTMRRNIWRAWLVVAVTWSAFWLRLYMISGPISSQQRLDRAAATALMMVLPWIGGWLMYWVLAGGSQD